MAAMNDALAAQQRVAKALAEELELLRWLETLCLTASTPVHEVSAAAAKARRARNNNTRGTAEEAMALAIISGTDAGFRSDPRGALALTLFFRLQAVDDKWPRYRSAHEGLGVMLEEFTELQAEVFRKQESRCVEALRREAMDVAVAALRFILSICTEEGARR